MTFVMPEQFITYAPRVAERISRVLYCHHCQEFNEDWHLLGRDDRRRTVFQCPSCAGRVRVHYQWPRTQ